MLFAIPPQPDPPPHVSTNHGWVQIRTDHSSSFLLTFRGIPGVFRCTLAARDYLLCLPVKR